MAKWPPLWQPARSAADRAARDSQARPASRLGGQSQIHSNKQSCGNAEWVSLPLRPFPFLWGIGGALRAKACLFYFIRGRRSAVQQPPPSAVRILKSCPSEQ